MLWDFINRQKLSKNPRETLGNCVNKVRRLWFMWWSHKRLTSHYVGGKYVQSHKTGTRYRQNKHSKWHNCLKNWLFSKCNCRLFSSPTNSCHRIFGFFFFYNDLTSISTERFINFFLHSSDSSAYITFLCVSYKFMALIIIWKKIIHLLLEKFQMTKHILPWNIKTNWLI